MSALTDLFSSMANKIRSKTGTATTYTPPQMVSDGIDDVFDAGVASATTSITPSDSSPVAMSANTGYKPTTAGYAIANNPTSLTPSNSSPVTISSGTIYKASGNGKAVASITDVTPSATPTSVSSGDVVKFGGSGKVVNTINDITPSNSSPVDLASGSIYKMGGAGKAIESYQSIHPSGQTGEIALSQDGIYKLYANGYAIGTFATPTPSDTSPALVGSYHIKPTTAGYLVKTVSDIGGTPDKTYANNSAGTSGSVDITVTKKPRYIILGVWSRGNTYQGMVGIIDVTKNQAYRMGYFTSAVAESWTNYTSYFTTISSTKVTYSYAGFSGNSRVQILIYY